MKTPNIHSLIQHQSPKKFNQFSWGLFIFLFSYLIVRGFVTETISDEVFSFFYFIEYGTYWGDQMQLDANNHLLNSFLSTQLNRTLGSSVFILRLANILAFGLYFWSLKKIAQSVFPTLFNQTTFLVSTVCIPFIFEYFGFSRGYGLSMAFLIASIYQLIKFQKHQKFSTLIISSCFTLLAIYSNLTILIPGIINLGFASFIFLNNKNLNIRSISYYLLLILVFGIALYPIYQFSTALKASGALYFGTNDNWWNSMVKSFIEVLFFNVKEWMKYLVFIFYLTLITLSINIAIKEKKRFINNPTFLFFWMLVGNYIAIELMAKVLQVNYPSYRVGMHLILFTIFLLNSVFSHYIKSNLLLIFLWLFPIGFIARMNLHTSVTTPSDRMTSALFGEIQHKIGDYTHVEMHHLQAMNYSFHARNSNQKQSVVTANEFNPYVDLIACFSPEVQNIEEAKSFSIVSTDKLRDQHLYKRRDYKSVNRIYKEQININKSSDDFLKISMETIPDSLKESIVKFHFKGKIKSPNKFPNGISLSFAFFDKDGKVYKYSETPLQWIHGSSEEFTVVFNLNHKIESSYSEWRLLIWNKYKQPITLENGNFELLQLIE